MANLSQALMWWKWCLGTGFSRDFTENRLNLIKPHSKYFARFLVNGKCWKQEQWDCSGSTASHTKGLQTNLTSAQVNSAQHCRVSVPTVLWAEPGEEKQLHGHFHPHSDENSNLKATLVAQHVTSWFALFTSLHTWKDSNLFALFLLYFLPKQGVLAEAKDICCWPKPLSIFSTDYRQNSDGKSATG